jgi:hypothetical protein
MKITVGAEILLWDTENIKIKISRYTNIFNIDKKRRKIGTFKISSRWRNIEKSDVEIMIVDCNIFVGQISYLK